MARTSSVYDSVIIWPTSMGLKEKLLALENHLGDFKISAVKV